MNETLWSVRAPADADLHNKKTHTHSTVQYHPPSFLYLSPDSWLHSLTLSEKKKKQPDKNERVFFQPLSPAALLPLLSFFLVHH